ncbi:MAG: hypothetical protein ABJF52_18240, partial [Aurantibacter sp.]
MDNKEQIVKWTAKALLLMFTMLLLLSCKSKEAEPEFLLRTALLVNENHTWYKAFEYFSQIIEERSKGRIKVQVYPSEQLAKEIEAIRLIQAEVIDMTTTGSTLTNWFEVATFCELPFLMQDSVD